MKNIERTRNFCIIAHIDHGKSTLADRLLDITEAVPERERMDQILDTMDLERERGITIKAQAVRVLYNREDGEYHLNLIDTPGHVDFAYEVSRAIAACEGALLIVDASQGIQAQTLANLYLAMEHDLEIIPVLNKIDLPIADVPAVTEELVELLGVEEEEIIKISAKTGENVTGVLDAIVDRVPAPHSEHEETRALIFDSHYDPYRGVISLARLFDGELKKGDRVRAMGSEEHFELLEVAESDGPPRTRNGRGWIRDRRPQRHRSPARRRYGHPGAKTRLRTAAGLREGVADRLLWHISYGGRRLRTA